MLFHWLQRSYSLPGTPKHYFPWNSSNFMTFPQIPWSLMKFQKFHQHVSFVRSLGCQAAQPLLFPKEFKGFVKGCGWLKTENIINFIRNHEIIRNSMHFHKIHWFSCISQDFGPAALERKKDSNSNAFPMVPVLIFLPAHSKIWFPMEILVPNQNFGYFHEIYWNLGAETDFNGSERSLAGPGWKPWYSYRNIKVSEPPRTTTITPKQRKS